MGCEGKRFITCKWGHDLSTAKRWAGARHCQVCKKERSKYAWYRIKCRNSGVVETAINWDEWARSCWGSPQKRKMEGI